MRDARDVDQPVVGAQVVPGEPEDEIADATPPPDVRVADELRMIRAAEYAEDAGDATPPPSVGAA